VIYSQEPTEAGWWNSTDTPLNVYPQNQDLFQNQDNRFCCFARFSTLGTVVDLTRLSPADSVLQDNGQIYVKAQLEPYTVFIPLGNTILNIPAVIMTLQNPVYQATADTVGDLAIIAQQFGTNLNDILFAMNRMGAGNMSFRIHPPMLQPDAAAVPLKSNILQYGPWYVQGAPGKVKFEYDQSLVPWNYGGWTLLQQAGTAKVSQAVTFMQYSETGMLSYVGTPNWSLGDVLQAGGPNVTGLEVGYSQQGVTTTYRFQTWTPKFGVFSRSNSERMKRIGITLGNIQKNVRSALRTLIAIDILGAQIDKGFDDQVFLAKAMKMVKKESPHDVFVGTAFTDPSTGNTRLGVSSMTYEEALLGLRGVELRRVSKYLRHEPGRAYEALHDRRCQDGRFARLPAAEQLGSLRLLRHQLRLLQPLFGERPGRR
jgi:hypothetical protein